VLKEGSDQTDGVSVGVVSDNPGHLCWGLGWQEAALDRINMQWQSDCMMLFHWVAFMQNKR
jgi:hypothetical protein